MASADRNPEVEAEDGDTVTLQELVAQDEEEEAEAIAILGASDHEKCSYPRGYVPRQALYACLSCRKDDQRSAVCLACSLTCHQGHDLVELYTKRNFRCDCGNGRQTTACQLEPEKEAENPKNVYNHNFDGKYCTCDKPYPEPESTEPDSQVQCVVCEDWFHTRHISQDGKVIDKVDWTEMICPGCVKRLPFLAHYDPGQVDTTSRTTGPCKIAGREGRAASALFFPDEAWREGLCGCEECVAVYGREGVEWLVREEDSVGAYEREGAARVPSSEAALAEALNATVPDPTAQREVIHGFNDMKDQLSAYFNSLPSGTVVKKDDIDLFFHNLNAKRPKLS